MKDSEEIFSENYANLLDLVERVSPSFSNQIFNFVSSLPKSIKQHIQEEDYCTYDSENGTMHVSVYSDFMDVEYLRYQPYLNVSMYAYPFYEEELNDYDENDECVEDKLMLIWSLTHKNTQNDPGFQFYYKENDGKYDYLGVEVDDGTKMDETVFIEKKKDDYKLIYIKSVNSIQVEYKELPISFEELASYSCVDYEEIDCDEMQEQIDYDVDNNDLLF